MKMTFQYTLADLQIGKYKSAVNKHLREALTAGVQQWLNAALAIIPIWSGASHGTFQKLAQKVGAEMGAVTSRDTTGRGLGEAAGAQQSVGKFIAFDFAYIAEYGTNLWHLVYNEYNNANLNPTEGRLFARLRRPGPYDFQRKAGDVFVAFARSVRLPNPWDSIKVTKRLVK